MNVVYCIKFAQLVLSALLCRFEVIASADVCIMVSMQKHWVLNNIINTFAYENYSLPRIRF